MAADPGSVPNLGRILGGDALNKVPDTCVIDVDIRYLPEQDPVAIQAQIEEIPDLYASPVAADGRVYVAGRDGRTVVFQHGPKLPPFHCPR